MSVKPFHSEYGDVQFHGSRDDERTVVGFITNGDVKFELRGYPKINRMLNSYKHGNEVQITVWNKLGTTVKKPRAKTENKWETVEIFFPIEVWNDLVREYYRYMKEIGSVT